MGGQGDVVDIALAGGEFISTRMVLGQVPGVMTGAFGSGVEEKEIPLLQAVPVKWL